MSNTPIDAVKKALLQLQQNICEVLTQEDGSKTFLHDAWENPGKGSGISCVLEEGQVIERGGVNFSHVYGVNLPKSASALHPELAGSSYQALGVSLVIHPRNPYAPTSHANVRFFYAEPQNAKPIWWFGGGFDLTPYYGFEEDCVHWHTMARAACQNFGNDVYPKYKKACDDYFYLPHRNEARGIGGLFFDDVNEWGFDTCFAFMQSVGDHFLKAYQPILARRKDMAYGERERQFQLHRRGRYVEFNLLYDRGTLFGIQSKGRTESILMSMPPRVEWHYAWQPETGTIEHRLVQDFLVAKQWLND